MVGARLRVRSAEERIASTRLDIGVPVAANDRIPQSPLLRVLASPPVDGTWMRDGRRRHPYLSDATSAITASTPGRSRTGDQQFRKLLLYPTELRGQKRKIAYPAGVRHPQRKTSVTESIKCLVLHDCVKLQAVERGTTI